MERKSYTVEFKLIVLKHLEENGNNISQTSREFGIDRKNVRRWLTANDKFQEERQVQVRYIRTGASKYPGKMLQRKALVIV